MSARRRPTGLNSDLEDAFNNPTTKTTATTVNLSSSTPGSGAAKFAATSGGSTITSVSLPANTQSVNAFYRRSKAGSPVITVAASGLTSDTQTQTIS